MLVAVGVEDDRPLAELLLQAVGVELRLLLADARRRAACAWPRPGRAACRRRPTARNRRSPCPALLGIPRDLELAVARLVERPAGLLQQQVDEVVAGLGLGVVVRVRRAPRSAFLAAATSARRRFSSASSAVLSASSAASFSSRSRELRFELLQLLGGLRRNGRRLRQQRRVEGQPGRGLRCRARRCGPASSRRGTARARRSARPSAGMARWLCTARLPSVLMSRALLKTASPDCRL